MGHDTRLTWVTLALIAAASAAAGCGSDETATNDAPADANSDATVDATDGDAPTPDVAPNTAPAVTHVEAPTHAIAGEPALLTFDWSDPDADLAAVIATRSNALGTATVRLNPAFMGMDGTGGTVSLPIPTRALPYGESSFTLVLEDDAGASAPPITFTIEVRGASNTTNAPTLTGLTLPAGSAYVRPGDPDTFSTPRITFDFADPDADIERVRVAITSPDGTTRTFEDPAAEWDIDGTFGSGAGRPLRLRDTDPPGDYGVTLTLFDRSARASASASVTLTVATDGVPSPAITRVTPAVGPAGTEVVLTGQGFSPEPFDNNITFDGVRADVVSASPTELVAIVPEGASSGALRLRSPDGLAVSTFTVPPSVTVSAETSAVAVGGTLQLTANVVSAGGPVEWRVDGRGPGGDTQRGTIDADGLYHAPPSPPASPVIISAHTPGNGPSGAITITVLPPPTPLGEGLILTTGGQLTSEDTNATLRIPPGAIGSDTVISVASLAPSARPVAALGRRIEAAVTFSPAGLAFITPAELTIGLDRAMAPGTPLTLRHYVNGTYGTSVAAVVDASGNFATAMVPHFSTWVVDAPTLTSGAPAPVLIALSPTNLTEGLRAPIRLTGTGLTPDLRVVIRHDDEPTADIVATGLRAVGNNAGVTLDVGVLRDLGANTSRTYTMVLINPEGLEASIDFTVTGLDEWVVPTGTTRTLTDPTPVTYSAVEIAGTVNIASGILDVTATRHVAISGALDAAGAHGQDAEGQAPGLSTGFAGSGGFGRGGDDDHRSRGGNGTPCWGTQPGCERINGNARPLGEGGAAGEDIGLFESIVSAVVNLVSCVLGDFASCIVLVTDIVAIVEDIGALSEDGGHGRGGAGAAVGGGGGGGGGAGSDDYIVYAITGGGGGAGGEPGRGIRLLSAGQLFIDGTVSTAGGDGGDGSQVGTATFIGIDVGQSSGFGGGGGGGGGSGLLQVAAATPIQRGAAATVTSQSGSGGLGGYLEVEEPTLRRFFFRTGTGGRGRVSARSVSDPGNERGVPVFDPATLDNGVTGRTVHVVRAMAAGADIRFRVTGENGQTAIVDTSVVAGAFQGTVVLFPGFNTIVAGRVSLASGAFNALTPPLLQKTVLVIATDSDADGLTDEDESILGTDPNNPDTDGDGALDGTEVAAGTDPRNDDSDGDGLFDSTEVALGLDPRVADMDSDGFSDGLEVVANTNPELDTSRPTTLPRSLLLAQRGADLMALDPGRGLMGRIGRPAGGLGFGLAAGPNTLYIATLTALARANPLTASPTTIGPYGTVGGVTLRTTTLAMNPIDGALYGVEHGPSPAFAPTGQLLRIDTSTGAATRVGAPIADAIHALVFDDAGTLYATVATATSDRLVTLDPLTNTVSATIGPVGATGVFGLAFLAGTLWATATDGAETRLYTIDPTSGATIAGGSLPGVVYDLSAQPATSPVVTSCTAPPDLDCNTNGIPDACDIAPHFALVAHYGMGAEGDLVAGDLDGDGDLDLVATAETGTVLVTNNGPGTFSVTRTLSPVSGGLALGDLDGDGDLDLVITDEATGTVIVRLNSGFGTFTTGAVVSVGVNPRVVVLADFDDDGDLDLAVGNAGVSSGFGWADASVSIALWAPGTSGPGSGGFGTATEVALTNQVQALVALDLDEDGASELVVHSAGPRVLRNNGLGSFVADANPLAFDFGYNGFAAADFNGDGHVDFVHGNAMWQSDGTGGLVAGATLPGFGTYGAGDLDGDGDVDLVVGSLSGQRVSMFANDTTAQFTARFTGVSTAGGYGTVASAVGDFDADGDLDVAFSSYGFRFDEPGQPWFAGVTVLRNRGYGGFDANTDGVPDMCE